MRREVDGVTYSVGIDFYKDWPKLDENGKWITKDSEGNAYFYDRSVATAHNASGLALSDLALTFASDVTVLPQANAMTGGSAMNACGEAALRHVVRVTDLGGLPTNGVVTVGPYATLDLAPLTDPALHGDGVSGGNTEIIVETNGLLQLSRRSVFSTWKQKLRLNGGACEYGHGMRQGQTSDQHFYANTVVLRDGARIFGAPPRVGFRTYTPAWIVTGDRPCICDSGVTMLAWTRDPDTETVYQLYVEDVTKDAEPDLLMNGRFYLFPDNTYSNITVRKTGAGTLLQKGLSTVKRETSVWCGAWIFGASGVSSGKQTFLLEGGTTLGLSAGVSNGLEKVVVKAPATFTFGEGSLLTLDALELGAKGKLELAGDFGKRSLHVATKLPYATLSRLSCAEGLVIQDENGYVRPKPKSMTLMIR
jgi:hypothetical protein